MMRVLIFFGILMWAVSAHATVCTTPPITSSYGQQFSGTTTVSGFNYDIPNKILMVILTSGLISWYFSPNYSVAQQFANTQNLGHDINGGPDSYFTSNIPTHYHWGLLDENCRPILAQNGGYIWSR